MQCLIAHPFEPVVNVDSRVLVLGSMPSEASMSAGFYYGHPRNAFWPIIASICGRTAPGEIDEKVELLYENKIALWDVLKSCAREGSLDSSIKCAQPNDFAAFFSRWPNIKAVFLNGGLAYKLFVKSCGKLSADTVVEKLPSTSPAYTIPFDKKLEAWRSALGRYVQTN